jgi:hypothetical protein
MSDPQKQHSAPPDAAQELERAREEEQAFIDSLTLPEDRPQKDGAPPADAEPEQDQAKHGDG